MKFWRNFKFTSNLKKFVLEFSFQRRWTFVGTEPELIQLREAIKQLVRVELFNAMEDGPLLGNKQVSSFKGFLLGVEVINHQAFGLQDLLPEFSLIFINFHFHKFSL